MPVKDFSLTGFFFIKINEYYVIIENIYLGGEF